MYGMSVQYSLKALTRQSKNAHKGPWAGDSLCSPFVAAFAKGEQVEQPAHVEALWQQKTRARQHRGQDRLSQASPLADTLLLQAAGRGHVLKTTVRLLLELLGSYGQEELHRALEEALQHQSPYPEAVHQILQRRREDRQQPPPIMVAVPDKAKKYTVKPARLADYDFLTTPGDNEDDVS